MRERQGRMERSVSKKLKHARIFWCAVGTALFAMPWSGQIFLIPAFSYVDVVAPLQFRASSLALSVFLLHLAESMDLRGAFQLDVQKRRPLLAFLAIFLAAYAALMAEGIMNCRFYPEYLIGLVQATLLVAWGLLSPCGECIVIEEGCAASPYFSVAPSGLAALLAGFVGPYCAASLVHTSGLPMLGPLIVGLSFLALALGWNEAPKARQSLRFIEGLLLFSLFNEFVYRVALSEGGLLRAVFIPFVCVAAATMLRLARLKKRGEAAKSQINAAEGLDDDPYGALYALSPREKEVFLAWLRGERALDIAEKLGLSPGTVGTYKTRALGKLGLDEDEIEALRQGLCVGEEKVLVEVPHSEHYWEIVLLLVSLYGILAPAFDFFSSSDLYAFALLAVAFCATWPINEGGDVSAQKKLSLRNGVWALIGAGLIGVQAYLASAAAESPWFYLQGFSICTITAVGMAVEIAWFRRGANGVLYEALKIPQELGCGTIALGVCLSDSSFPYVSWLGNHGYLAFIILCLATGVIIEATRTESPDTAMRSSEKQEERALSYLKGRGLNELQARVVLLTAEGKSRTDICDLLSVAGGTVNSYRAAGYRLLGVHSVDQLKGLLQKDAGMSLS